MPTIPRIDVAAAPIRRTAPAAFPAIAVSLPIAELALLAAVSTLPMPEAENSTCASSTVVATGAFLSPDILRAPHAAEDKRLIHGQLADLV